MEAMKASVSAISSPSKRKSLPSSGGASTAFGLIEPGLDASGDPCVATLAGGPIVENAGAESAEIAAHQLREGTLDGGKVLVGLDDCEEGIGARRKVGEMVGGCGHDEMEVAIGLLAVAFGHHRLEGRGCLLECRARLGCIATKLAKAQAEP